ncbi:Candidapepsin-10 [Spathaspora sp. JA1]|nr:Candidapepsin-10 [Spathaspora sp. JA1]
MNYWLLLIVLFSNLVSIAKAGLTIRDDNNQGFAQMDIYSTNGSFVTDLEIGSNNQPVTLLISDSYADMLVMLPNVTCKSGYQYIFPYVIIDREDFQSETDASDNSNCTGFGVFDPNQSTTFYQHPAKKFFVYNDPDDDTFSFAGVWGQDDIKFNDNFQVFNLTFGVSHVFNQVIGVLGLGPTWLELQSLAGKKEYANLPSLLVQQNITQRNVYSMFMNTEEAKNGTILFGAIDYSKFDFLETRPIDSHLASQWEFGLSSREIWLENYETEEFKRLYDKSMPVQLDYNLPNSELPSNILKSLVQNLGITYDSSALFQEISCDMLDSEDEFIAFKFGLANNSISVPISSLITQEDDKCMLAITTPSDNFPSVTFGLNILKYVYLVYDLERFEISIGLRTFNESAPANISVITKQTSRGPLDSELKRAVSKANNGIHFTSTFAFIVPIVISLLFW